jgi:hypothetical protein
LGKKEEYKFRTPFIEDKSMASERGNNPITVTAFAK